MYFPGILGITPRKTQNGSDSPVQTTDKRRIGARRGGSRIGTMPWLNKVVIEISAEPSGLIVTASFWSFKVEQILGIEYLSETRRARVQGETYLGCFVEGET